MPLQALSRTLNLPDAVTRVAKPHWIFSETVNWLGVTVLVVYRSPLVWDDSPMYAAVADLISRAAVVDEIIRGTVEDEGMMFGQAECVVYMLYASDHAAQPTDPRVVEAIGILKAWGPPVHPLLVVGKMVEALDLVRE